LIQYPTTVSIGVCHTSCRRSFWRSIHMCCFSRQATK